MWLLCSCTPKRIVSKQLLQTSQVYLHLPLPLSRAQYLQLFWLSVFLFNCNFWIVCALSECDTQGCWPGQCEIPPFVVESTCSWLRLCSIRCRWKKWQVLAAVLTCTLLLFGWMDDELTGWVVRLARLIGHPPVSLPASRTSCRVQFIKLSTLRDKE